MRFLPVALLLCVSSGLNAAAAQFTTIDFELGAPCSFSSSTVLRGEYSALGVQFRGDPAAGSEGGAVLNDCGNFGISAMSGTDFLAFNQIASNSAGLSPITPQVITFASSVGTVSISVAGGSGGGGSFSIAAFNAIGNQIGTGTAAPMPNMWGELSVSDPLGTIARVEIMGADSDNAFVMDDLVFGFGVSASYCIPDTVSAPCPCGNEPSVPGSAQGCVNSTGQGASLIVLGSASLSAANTTLAATGVPSNQFGILFSGFGAVQSPFGDGLRCVTGGIVRSAPINSGPNSLIRLLDAGNALGGSVGQVRNFQCWYRDPGGPCSSAFNLSTAVSITFQP